MQELLNAEYNTAKEWERAALPSEHGPTEDYVSNGSQ